MQSVGAVLVAIGVAWGIFALKMDTTVSSGYGAVNNIGLISERQIHLGLAGLLILVGVVLIAAATIRHSISPDGDSRAERMRCPDCAELIRIDASVCRFCGRDMKDVHAAAVAEQAAENERAHQAALRKQADYSVWREAHPWLGRIPAKSVNQAHQRLIGAALVLSLLVMGLGVWAYGPISRGLQERRAAVIDEAKERSETQRAAQQQREEDAHTAEQRAKVVIVPNVVGIGDTTAGTTIREAGLTPQIDSSWYYGSRVFRQEPPAGKQVHGLDVVVLYFR